jgi:excisionase family DNA binding protein
MQDTATSSTRQPLSPHPPKEFLSVKELSELLGVTDRTAWNWIGEGIVPSIRVGGVRRIRRSDVEAMFDRENQAS